MWIGVLGFAALLFGKLVTTFDPCRLIFSAKIYGYFLDTTVAYEYAVSNSAYVQLVSIYNVRVGRFLLW